mgnify:CR=1 FL=1
MKQIITGWDHIFGPWLMEKTDGTWVPGRGSTIGLLGPDGILGCAYYSDCNGASVMLHCAGEGKTWLNREFLWFAFYYPFEQLKVSKIISPVESWNTNCQIFIEHLGFRLEATLEGASPKGDLLLYTMTKEQCRWLSLQGKYRGKTESSNSA